MEGGWLLGERAGWLPAYKWVVSTLEMFFWAVVVWKSVISFAAG